MTTVLVVDDDPLVRRLLRTILTQQGVDVVAEASDGDEAVPAVQSHRPDVVLMDLRMARMDGVAATAAVCRLPEPPGVIALTSFDTEDVIVRAVQAGAQGFLAKDASAEEIVAAVRDVAGGGGALSARAARVVVGRVADDVTGQRRSDAHERLAALSVRELEVARAVATGLTNAEIAARTYCSEATVKTLLARAMAKLDVGGRVQLAVLVDRAGLAEA